jgi:leucyl aminopeptidase
MDVTLNRDPKWSKIDHLFVVLTENDNQFPIKSMQKVVRDSGFKGRSEETITLLADEPRKITLIGAGEKSKLSLRTIRAAIYLIGKTAKKQRDKSIAVAIPYKIPDLDAANSTRVLADALAQADYKYDAYITKKDEDGKGPIDATLIPLASLDAKRLKQIESDSLALRAGIRTVRDLGNGPANLVTPAHLAERAQEIARSAGVKCKVFGKKEIEKMKMGGLLAVNQGSAKEPRFIVLEYSPKNAKKHVALVGKGITFDSGGISIKPAERMEEMKFDMCGAAAVIGTIEAAAKLGLPVKITGAIPSTENLPSGNAYKPGDIVRMMNGKTVEIVNTDAEGRMILGDALHYASELKPDHLIDYATLTGAMVVALASEAAGLFSNDDELARKLIESGERAGERLWRMPIWDDYKDLIRSEWADMKNSGGRWGGAISAAMFLKEFVDCPSWAHLDIAGTAYAEQETAREARGATGAGVRVTVAFLESLSRR